MLNNKKLVEFEQQFDGIAAAGQQLAELFGSLLRRGDGENLVEVNAPALQNGDRGGEVASFVNPGANRVSSLNSILSRSTSAGFL